MATGGLVLGFKSPSSTRCLQLVRCCTYPIDSDGCILTPEFFFKERATTKQVEEMLQTLRVYIKIAVDIEKGILAGGGEQHAECEAFLLKNGSKQKDIWGADWLPFTQEIAYESIINLRPSQNNRSMIIQDLAIRERVKQITVELIGGHEPEFK